MVGSRPVGPGPSPTEGMNVDRYIARARSEVALAVYGTYALAASIALLAAVAEFTDARALLYAVVPLAVLLVRGLYLLAEAGFLGPLLGAYGDYTKECLLWAFQSVRMATGSRSSGFRSRVSLASAAGSSLSVSRGGFWTRLGKGLGRWVFMWILRFILSWLAVTGFRRLLLPLLRSAL